ncbi:MAG: response regulator [Janthinobacterium lividum]
MSATRILIVEDEFLIRLTLAEALADEGFDVVEAETGDEALRLIETDPAIQLMLTDMQLPGTLDGAQLAARARAHNPELPIIFVTGRAEVAHALLTARDLFIAKPYLPSEVCSAARKLIAA